MMMFFLIACVAVLIVITCAVMLDRSKENDYKIFTSSGNPKMLCEVIEYGISHPETIIENSDSSVHYYHVPSKFPGVHFHKSKIMIGSVVYVSSSQHCDGGYHGSDCIEKDKKKCVLIERCYKKISAAFKEEKARQKEANVGQSLSNLLQASGMESVVEQSIVMKEEKIISDDGGIEL